MAEIPGRFSISKMLCKETHDILVIQGIQLFDSIGERIHDPIHLLHFYMVIDVSPPCISTSHQAVNCLFLKIPQFSGVSSKNNPGERGSSPSNARTSYRPISVKLRRKKHPFPVGAEVDDVWGGDACVALVLFPGAPSPSSPGDASVPTPHPHRSRPYGTTPSSPWGQGQNMT